MWIKLNGILVNIDHVAYIAPTDDGNLLVVVTIPMFKQPNPYNLIVEFDDDVHAFWDWMCKTARRPIDHPWTPS